MKKLAYYLIKAIQFMSGGSKSLPSLNPSRNCVIVLDSSPSMDEKDWYPSRLAGAKESALEYIRQLASEAPGSNVAVVKYGTTAKIVAPLTPVKNYEFLSNRIMKIRTGFFTNITAGLKEAYSICKNLRAINQVILLSDGYHNTGIGPKRISKKLKKYATIECVGIGGSTSKVDAKLMQYIASSRPDGTKRYRWIGHKEQLIEHFKSLATGLARA